MAVTSRMGCLRSRRKAQVLLLCIAAAVGYGIVHDEITSRICVEYFTLGHADLFRTQSPMLLAIGWGILATIGLGAVFGLLLAEISQSEGMVGLAIHTICRQLMILLLVMGGCAAGGGLLGYLLSSHSVIGLPAGFRETIPVARQDRFIAVWFAHGASYLVGFVGAGSWIWRTWNQRAKPRVLLIVPRTKVDLIRSLIVAGVAGVVLYVRFHTR